MQQANQPPKFLQPLAQNDASKADIPVTSPDDTRASQSLGFPPRTGQPPEAGGVPPQLPDMNGVLNLASRGSWWNQLGGGYGYDGVFATDPLINGYPQGATLRAADGLGDWISTVNDNAVNPDTVGTGWVPGYSYGATALTSQTGGTVTLTPAQARKRVLTVAGTLTSNLVLVVPNWRYDWTVYNNTGGAFSVTVRTAGGAGASVPQNGAPTPVLCDGTNCALSAPNIGPATSAGQALQLGQAGGRLLNVQTFTASGTYTPTAGTRFVIVDGVGGGGAGGGARAAPAGQSVGGGGGGSGAYFRTQVAASSSGFAGAAVTVGVGGIGVGEATGGDGTASSFGAFASAPGGKGGTGGNPTVAFPNLNGYGPGADVATGGTLINATGSPGGFALLTSSTNGLSGTGGASAVGGGGNAVVNQSADGVTAVTPGAGGSGALTLSGGPSRVGGNGAPGRVIIYEYA